SRLDGEAAAPFPASLPVFDCVDLLHHSEYGVRRTCRLSFDGVRTRLCNVQTRRLAVRPHRGAPHRHADRAPPLAGQVVRVGPIGGDLLRASVIRYLLPFERTRWTGGEVVIRSRGSVRPRIPDSPRSDPFPAGPVRLPVCCRLPEQTELAAYSHAGLSPYYRVCP